MSAYGWVQGDGSGGSTGAGPAAHEVWEVSEEERLAGKALAGEPID